MRQIYKTRGSHGDRLFSLFFYYRSPALCPSLALSLYVPLSLSLSISLSRSPFLSSPLGADHGVRRLLKPLGGWLGPFRTVRFLSPLVSAKACHMAKRRVVYFSHFLMVKQASLLCTPPQGERISLNSKVD